MYLRLFLLFICSSLVLAQAEEQTFKLAKNLINVSSSKNIVFCWSNPDHPKNTHSYKKLADKWTKSLARIDKLTTLSVEGFPDKKTWEKADLVVFNLTHKEMTAEQLKLLDSHLVNGKSIAVLHMGLVQKNSYKEWTERLGYAFNWDENPKKSKWGIFDMRISLDTSHEITMGLPDVITVKDELYWNLRKGSKGKITVLGTTADDKGEGLDWPVFWTVQHKNQNGKEGRVFCSVLGHFDEVANSELFETILLQAFSWCLK